ncbi:MAG: Bax inhibitor-1/YccA family protein [Actinomycetes bacterium]
MQSNNPVLTRMEAEAKRNGGYAGFGTATVTAPAPSPGAPSSAPPQYQAPAAPQPVGATMAMPDVIAKTALMFLVMLPIAVAAWVANVPMAVFFGAMIGALVVGIWASVKREPSPVLFLLYAALEGIVLGAISKVYNDWAVANGAQSGIVGTAVLGTLIVFALMLGLYSTRIIKVTNRVASIFTLSLLGYLGLSLVSVMLGFFGVGDGFGVFGLGWMGILFSLLGVGLASFSLVMDFAAIESMIAAGAPEKESWRAAFGLVVTLVWLYLELLRLLAILSSGR